MAQSVQFESVQFLVVTEDDNVIFRCPIYLADLGELESLETFIDRRGGMGGTITYLRRLLYEETLRSMGLRVR